MQNKIQVTVDKPSVVARLQLYHLSSFTANTSLEEEVVKLREDLSRLYAQQEQLHRVNQYHNLIKVEFQIKRKINKLNSIYLSYPEMLSLS